jgi:hypothetical protein
LRYFLLVPFWALQARRSGSGLAAELGVSLRNFSFDVCPKMPPIGLRYLKAIYDQIKAATAHGGNASDAFNLVIPSMPGYGYSGKPTTTGWDVSHIARASQNQIDIG